MQSSESSWRPGITIHSPVVEYVSTDFSKTPPPDRYRLLTSTVTPRPIAFVSTINQQGVGNLAPFSFFNALSSNPACVMLSIASLGIGHKKHTLQNIETTKEFVINFSSEWLLGPMVFCAANFPDGVDELHSVGLTSLDSDLVKPKRVKESPAHLECRLYDTLKIGDGSPGSTTVIIGEVLKIHVWNEAYKNGRINTAIMKPLGRLGGADYTRFGEIVSMPVPNI